MQTEKLNGSGFVYVMSNPAFRDDLYKIGMTCRSAEERRQELSNHTGVAEAYVVELSFEVANAQFAEALIHQRLKCYRSNKAREFFEISLRIAKIEIQSIVDAVNAIAVVEPLDKSSLHPVIATEVNHAARWSNATPNALKNEAYRFILKVDSAYRDTDRTLAEVDRISATLRSLTVVDPDLKGLDCWEFAQTLERFTKLPEADLLRATALSLLNFRKPLLLRNLDFLRRELALLEERCPVAESDNQQTGAMSQ